MRIIAKLGPKTINVEVQPDEPLYILGDKLGIGRKAKFVFKGMSYTIASSYTFRKIGMEDNTRIFVIVEDHMCPYGCERMIPFGYKGCTELLQERPNYFN